VDGQARQPGVRSVGSRAHTRWRFAAARPPRSIGCATPSGDATFAIVAPKDFSRKRQWRKIQGRLFSYTDTQLIRLGGPNFHELEINRPRCPMRNFQRDGVKRQNVPTGRVAYEPNSLDLAGRARVPSAATRLSRSGSPATSRGSVPKASLIITARPGSSSAR
jgi:hypothetical protein